MPCGARKNSYHIAYERKRVYIARRQPYIADLSTGPDNARAKHVYEKVGFTETDVVEEEDYKEVNMVLKAGGEQAPGKA